MAKFKVLAVYDSKAESFGQPMTFRSRGEALRAFQTVANDEQSSICKFPADFTLFEIGEYEEESGDLTMYPNGKVSLGLALEFKNKPVDQVAWPCPGQKEGN